MVKSERGARISRVANPNGGALPRVVRGGSLMAAKKASTSRARNRSGGAKKRTGGGGKGRARSRSRSRNSANVGAKRSGGGQFRARSKNPATATKRNGRPGRRRKTTRSRNPFTLSGFGEILKDLGYAGGGAFGVSTISQIVPMPVTSPWMVGLVQVGLSWVVGKLGGWIFGAKNEVKIRNGGFAFTAGNFVQNQFPGFQQKILSFSPIRAARSVAGAPAAALAAGDGPPPLQETIMTSDELNDITNVLPGRFGYMGDITVRQPGQYGYGTYGY